MHRYNPRKEKDSLFQPLFKNCGGGLQSVPMIKSQARTGEKLSTTWQIPGEFQDSGKGCTSSSKTRYDYQKNKGKGIEVKTKTPDIHDTGLALTIIYKFISRFYLLPLLYRNYYKKCLIQNGTIIHDTSST